MRLFATHALVRRQPAAAVAPVARGVRAVRAPLEVRGGGVRVSAYLFISFYFFFACAWMRGGGVRYASVPT
jgi:hypothetical protein